VLYEIVWFRRLHLALGVSIFAVGAVVSAFMLVFSRGRTPPGLFSHVRPSGSSPPRRDPTSSTRA